jgi:hypothetical protein
VAEWLRRWIANPLFSERESSNLSVVGRSTFTHGNERQRSQYCDPRAVSAGTEERKLYYHQDFPALFRILVAMTFMHVRSCRGSAGDRRDDNYCAVIREHARERTHVTSEENKNLRTDFTNNNVQINVHFQHTMVSLVLFRKAR